MPELYHTQIHIARRNPTENWWGWKILRLVKDSLSILWVGVKGKNRWVVKTLLMVPGGAGAGEGWAGECRLTGEGEAT